ncbi:hypothetical protein SI65_00451 [Aspergillus cristatus]|uniref:Uncharacterized protein n=1 Tax=Aspergillus cristatus TaxID=573508 RepID=A0A1E3BPH2_ASPCR|nr:hypothetical protein SI65_00451 [Aspergillus cristatus]
MEPACDLLARPLPDPLFDNSSWTASNNHNHPVSAEYLHPWTTFKQDIQSTLQSLDLSKPVSKTDSSEGEKYLIRNKRGLATRFVHNVCDPVAKALSTTSYQDLVFGDVEGVQSSDDSFLGLIKQRPETVYWIVVVGISYWPVFIRRVTDSRFELSVPIDYRATGLSLRGYFIAFAIIAAKDTTYLEAWKLRSSALHSIHHQTATQGDTSTNNMPPADTNTDIGTNNTTTANSILFGDKEVVKASVTCVRIIHSIPDKKAVMEVLFNGGRAIAKCWSDELYERHAHSTDKWRSD